MLREGQPAGLVQESSASLAKGEAGREGDGESMRGGSIAREPGKLAIKAATAYHKVRKHERKGL